MAQTIRRASIVVTRAADSGVNVFAEGESVHGKAANIKLPDVVHPHNDRYGPIGMERDWNHTVELTDCTFDLLEANQAPESLGPVDLNFEFTELFANGKRRKYRVRSKMQTAGAAADDRTTDNPRTMTLFPYEYIMGGGAAIAEHCESLDKPTASSSTGAFTYVNTRDGEYWTRTPGNNGVKHLPLATTG